MNGFYGYPEVGQRDQGWRLLKDLKSCDPEPWLYFGDLNENLCQAEKYGAAWRSPIQMASFRKVLNVCDLSCLDYKGPRYTWCNNRKDGNFTKERLDGVVVNKNWFAIYPNVDVNVLPAKSSDHCPLWINLNPQITSTRKNKPFRFEANWVLFEECNKIVDSIWASKCGPHTASTKSFATV